ncbi:hypothetical protein MSAN_00582000 [Mycena sanguinolenta]|uniref:Uncharacterized protein n=1 Tax=Mycena sanguinolenta TaxID=230812 RepID=A0A8H6Z702_9AGAR|nr:hypothetical protein MSAN_00582000 [Mycena sanguinolenta]
MDLLNRLLNAKYFILRHVLHVEQVDGDDCYIMIARWISRIWADLIAWLKDILWAVVKWIYNTFRVFLAWPGNALYSAAQRSESLTACDHLRKFILFSSTPGWRSAFISRALTQY